MEQVTVNMDYGIVIPTDLIKKLNIKIGQKLAIEEIAENIIVLSSYTNISELYGSLQGIDTNIERDGDR